jgi:hypothetical protein
MTDANLDRFVNLLAAAKLTLERYDALIRATEFGDELAELRAAVKACECAARRVKPAAR